MHSSSSSPPVPPPYLLSFPTRRSSDLWRTGGDHRARHVRHAAPGRAAGGGASLPGPAGALSAAPGTPRGIRGAGPAHLRDRKSTRLNSSHLVISYAVFCLKIKRVHIVV